MKYLKVSVYFKLAMQELGHKEMTHEDVEKMIAEVDLNKNHEVEFSEFLKVFKI